MPGIDTRWLAMFAIALSCSAPSGAAPARDSVAIAPVDEALTFARAGHRTLAVTSYVNGGVEGVDLTALLASGEDAIDLVQRLGFGAIREAVVHGVRASVDAATLGLPVRLAAAHIAAGTNYREHADEASVEGGPFLFPKLVVPTSARAPIPARQALLDYEVELCLVTMEPIGPHERASGALILCNDVTDRATLLRNVDPSDPQSGKGFTSGKSAPGYLPVGDLLVVPRDLQAYVAGLELRLSVNGRERQRAPVTDWIWDFDEILDQARARRNASWAYRGGTARFPFTPDGTLPSRTLILAGTPAGTVFQGIDKSDYAWGLFEWLAGGWGESVVHHVIERHIAAARRARTYLQPGDEVTIRVDRLGVLHNRVVQ
jgi:2,4-diketo-3-deoxy-L-fuconate hydrolase